MTKKIISHIPQILALLFIVGFAVYAWTEPTQAPPGGNVPAPINVGTEPQAKAGRLSATEFYDYNDPSYYLNPSGSSVIDTLCLGGECFNRWPAWEECKGVCASSNAVDCGAGWTPVASHSGTGCEGVVDFGIKPRWGGEWEFGNNGIGCCNNEVVSFNGRLQMEGIRCSDSSLAGSCEECGALSERKYPSSCVICCK